MSWSPQDDRYERMPFRRCGRSGLKLPVVSLGIWQAFGGERPYETSRAILRRAIDLGITHLDAANNYGPPPGSAEEVLGRVLATDFRGLRDELVITTKAGYDMWPGPYGSRGSSRKYLLASLDQSLGRLGLDYVDIFYSHGPDTETPLEETIGALDQAVRSGRALYVGISSYSPEMTRESARIAKELGTPLIVHQPSYSMINRWIEDGLLDALEETGMGCVAFSPLSQGLLTNRYLSGVAPEGSRFAPAIKQGHDILTPERMQLIKALNEIALDRGQTLAQLALAWVLRDPRVTTALVGASSVQQLEDSVGVIDRLELTEDELSAVESVLQGD